MSLENVSIYSSFFSQMQVISKKHTLQTPPIVNKPFSTLISGSFLSCMLSASNKPPFQYATEPAVTARSGQQLSVFSKCLHSQCESLLPLNKHLFQGSQAKCFQGLRDRSEQKARISVGWACIPAERHANSKGRQEKKNLLWVK